MTNRYKSRSLLIGLLFIYFFPINAESSNSDVFTNDQLRLLKVVAATGAVAIGGLYIADLAYQQYKSYFADRIDDKIADEIVLMLTPNLVIHQWPKKEQGIALRNKAKLINMRKRVLAQLQKKIDEPNNLSKQHVATLKKDIKRVRFFFKTIDAIRMKNSFEKEYEKPSIIDQIIENNIINSVIIALKPEIECTPEELKQRKASFERRAKILERVKSKIKNKLALEPLPSSLLFFQLFDTL